MDIGEKFTALENIIFQYACTQFDLNQIPPSEARIVMKCVYSRFQELCLNSDLMNRVSIQQPQGISKSVPQSGTTEELKERFNAHNRNQNSGEEGKDDNS